MTPMSAIQCKACPWKRAVVPSRDIPGGYSVAKHRGLARTIAVPGSLCGTESAMACHESERGAERVCVGWAVHQLGVGNNIALRIQAMRDPRLQGLRTIGPQHKRFEDTLDEVTVR